MSGSSLFPPKHQTKVLVFGDDGYLMSLDLRGQQNVPRAGHGCRVWVGAVHYGLKTKNAWWGGYQMLELELDESFFSHLYALTSPLNAFLRTWLVRWGLLYPKETFWGKKSHSQFKVGGDLLLWPNCLSTWSAVERKNHRKAPSTKLWPQEVVTRKYMACQGA